MRKNKGMWPGAFGASILAHAAVFAIICGIAILFPPQVEKGPIEVDLVTDMGGGGGGGGGGGSPEAKAMEDVPKIKEAAATPTAPPPAPPQAAPDPEAENDVHDIADTQKDSAPAPSSSDSSASDSTGSDSDRGYGSGTGSGGGNGSGTGTGTGSGTGEGSGSGSGGGNGSGTGTGDGDGYGDGSGGGSGGGETMGPQILSAPSPSYPESARRAGVSGTTVVGLTISSDGSVTSAWVESSSGNAQLDSAAVSAVYGWQFVPAKQNGQAITVNSRVPVTFNLR